MKHASFASRAGLCAGLAFSAFIAAPAIAADIYQPAPAASFKDEPMADMPPITWAGFYLGGHLGASIDDSDKKYSGSPAIFSYDDGEEFLGGVHAGYNWQRQRLLLGIEGDVSFTDKIEYLSSVRGRVGLATDSWLFYGTAGVAFIGKDDDFRVNGVRFKDDGEETGFVAGAGIEKKIGERASLGVEGLYYDFDDEKISGPGFTVKDDADFWSVRARFNYHLN